MNIFRRRKSTEQPRVLLCFCVAFCAVALSVTLQIDGGVWEAILKTLILACILCAALLLLWGKRYISAMLGLLFGMLWCSSYLLIIYSPTAQFDGYFGDITVRFEQRAEGYGTFSMASVEIVEVNNRSVSMSATAFLTDASPDYHPGQLLSFEGLISVAQPDDRSYMHADGKFLTVSQTSVDSQSLGVEHNLASYAATISQSLHSNTTSLISGDRGGLLAALLSGDRSGYSPAFQRQLTASGIAHITAVSGLHISMLTAFAMVLLGRKYGAVAALPLIIAYAIITGLSPSVVRAAIMNAAVLLGFFIKRESDSLTSLSLALLIITAQNPFAIHSVGLLLSFGATLGILLFAPDMYRAMCVKLPKHKLLRRVLVYIFGTCAASISAMIFVLPLSIIFFESVSVIAVLTNILVLWAVALSMALGIFMLLFTFIWQPLAQGVALLVIVPLGFVEWVAKTVSSLSFVTLSSENYYLIIFAIALILAVIAVKIKRFTYTGIAIFGVISLAVCIGLTAIESSLYGQITIYGQNGNAAVIARANAQTAVINTPLNGSSDPYFISERLGTWGESQVDYAVSSKNTVDFEDLSLHVAVNNVVAPTATIGNADMYYNSQGSLELCGGFLEILGEQDQFAYRLIFDQISLLDLSTLSPPHTAQMLEHSEIKADLLIIDGDWIASSHYLSFILDKVSPQLLIVADSPWDSYSGDILGINTVYLQESAPINITFRQE